MPQELSIMPAAPPVLTLPLDLVQQIQHLAGSFDAGWHTGSPPPLESLLDQIAPEGRPELFRQLLRLEADHRRQQGNTLTAAEARQRFANLGPWVAELLSSLEEGAALVLDVVAGPQTGRSFQMAGHTTFLVGRGPTGVHLALEGDLGMSRAHFLIELNPPRARLADLRSKNGTFVNGTRVEHADLRDGDEIRAGQSTLRIKLPQGEHTLTVNTPALSPTEMLVPPPASLPAIPGYTLEEEIGRGGMGVVYRASRRGDCGFVALKTVLPAVAPHHESLARFQREMAILRRLTHPNIVGFLDCGEAAGLLYFVMEYIDGPSASRLVKLDGPMSHERVVKLGCQLLEALAHAHLQGIVHRDVKPGNILLARQDGREVLKLADFGLGRTYQESAMSGLTMAGTPGGTPGFMAPEQVLDFRTARPTADQYGAAATLYYLLTGQPIYEPAASPTDLLVNIMQREPIPLRQQAPDSGLPAKLHALFCRALARDPRQRFPDVLAMREALSRSV